MVGLDRPMYDVSYFFFLLAVVAASQVDLSAAATLIGPGETDFSSCPITFYGRQYTMVNVSKIEPC